MTVDLSNTTFSHNTPAENELALSDFMKHVSAKSDERAAYALSLIFQYGQIDGSHHKAWSLDQVARILAGEKYEDFISECRGDWLEDEGSFAYSWDEGVAP